MINNSSSQFQNEHTFTNQSHKFIYMQTKFIYQLKKFCLLKDISHIDRCTKLKDFSFICNKLYCSKIKYLQREKKYKKQTKLIKIKYMNSKVLNSNIGTKVYMEFQPFVITVTISSKMNIQYHFNNSIEKQLNFQQKKQQKKCEQIYLDSPNCPQDFGNILKYLNSNISSIVKNQCNKFLVTQKLLSISWAKLDFQLFNVYKLILKSSCQQILRFQGSLYSSQIINYQMIIQLQKDDQKFMDDENFENIYKFSASNSPTKRLSKNLQNLLSNLFNKIYNKFIYVVLSIIICKIVQKLYLQPAAQYLIINKYYQIDYQIVLDQHEYIQKDIELIKVQSMLHIDISLEIKPTDLIQTITTIVVNQYQIPVAEILVQFPINQQQNFKMIKQGSQFYIVIQISDQPNKEQENSIEKLISLSDRIVCIELDQELQSKIQKFYIGTIPQLYVYYTADSKQCIQKPSLTFINQSYKKIYTRQLQGIFYYKTVEQYNTNKFLTQAIRRNISSLTNIGTLKIFSQLQQSPKTGQKQNTDDYTSIQFPALTAGQLLLIYNNTALSMKDSTQIKYLMLSYRELMYRKQKKLKAESIIFEQAENDVNKSVLRQIYKENNNLDLTKKQMNKMQWKYNRLKIFSDLLWQQNVNIELVRKYKKCSLFQMQNQIIILQIQQFYRVWIRNTLQQLKKAFSKIANRRDTKALSQFRSKYHSLVQKLQKCQQDSRKIVDNIDISIGSSSNIKFSYNSIFKTNAQKNYILVRRMNRQIQQFISSHQYVLKDEYLNSLKYVLYQFKYMWNNQPKIYHKVGFFLLIIFLAYLQKNIIISFTLISLGLIFSAINI